MPAAPRNSHWIDDASLIREAIVGAVLEMIGAIDALFDGLLW